MKGNRTFTLLKPDVIKNSHLGEILHIIQKNEFKIVGIKLTRLSRVEAADFYSIHQGKSFYHKLIDFMTSGPIVSIVLEKENAVENFRELIGNTDPSQAAKGTIRQIFGTNKTMNAIHGSDSDENAVIESNFYFSKRELFE